MIHNALQDIRDCLNRMESLLRSERDLTFHKKDIEDMRSMVYSLKGNVAKIEEFVVKGDDKNAP